MMNFDYYPFGWSIFGPIFMIFWWGLIIFIVVLIVRWMSSQGEGMHGHHKSQALEILKQRYAKGEIDKREFEEKKKDLE